jgi:transposase-like protein
MARSSGAGLRRVHVGRGERWREAERSRYLMEFAASGLSAAAFVRQTGLPSSTFGLWRRQARRRRGRPARPRSPVAAGFAQVEMLPPPTGTAGLTLLVRTGRGVTAECTGLDPATAVALLGPMLLGPSR